MDEHISSLYDVTRIIMIGGNNMAEDKSNTIIIQNFTDPICTWCWGSEPVLRKLETHYPNIEIRYVMGGLVDDIHNFRDDSNDIGGNDIESVNKQIVTHWEEAAEHHGMPVESKGFALFSNTYPSSYPQNIAYKAAQKIDQEKADLFLYNIRAASAAEAKLTNRLDVLTSLADASGIDVSAFLENMNNGSAEGAFRGDMALGKALGVQGFPTFLVKYNNQQVMLRGFQEFDTFVSVINMISNGKLIPLHPPISDEHLLSFMERHPRLAAAEIMQAYNLGSQDKVDEWVERLVDEGKVEKQVVGQSYFINKITSKNSCDPKMGVCL